MCSSVHCSTNRATGLEHVVHSSNASRQVSGTCSNDALQQLVELPNGAAKLTSGSSFAIARHVANLFVLQSLCRCEKGTTIQPACNAF